VVAFAQSAAPKQKLPKRIVADYTNGSKYLNPPYDVAQIPFDKLTHINHAGVPWDANGVLQVPDGFVEPDLISKAHATGVKVMLLTGGDFAAAEGDPAVLDAVVANLQTFVFCQRLRRAGCGLGVSLESEGRGVFCAADDAVAVGVPGSAVYVVRSMWRRGIFRFTAQAR